MHLKFSILALALAVGTPLSQGLAADAPAGETISLAEGKLTLTAPAGWAKKEPKFRGIALYEFAAPKAEGDGSDGRITIGALNGGMDANQQRWLAQFAQPDGSKTEDRVKRTEKESAGAKIHMLDISGTYVVPPFAGGGKHPDYRQLAAIIDSPKHGSWYVRFYGPQKTVAQHAAAFEAMLDGLKAQ